MRSAFRIVIILCLGIAAGVALAADPPLNNWTVPKSSAFGRTAHADISPGPLVFVAISPCRVIDTRGNGFTGEWGPPSMPGNGVQRSFTIAGRCGIPTGVTAVSFNFTVWAPSTRGDIRVFPTGSPSTVSTLNWEANILAQANAAVAPLGGGKVTVQVDGAGTINLIVDVNGYYIGGGNDLNPSERLWLTGSWAGFGIIKGTNNAPGGYGGFFEALGASIGSVGVFGSAIDGIGVQGTSSTYYGVYGSSTNSIGVYGYSATGADGVFGKSGDSNAAGVHGQLTASVNSSAAVWGEHQSTGPFGIGVTGTHAGTGYGVFGHAAGTTGEGAIGVFGRADSSTDSTKGVYGLSVAATGVSYGVHGVTNSTAQNAAGVLGVAGGRSFTLPYREAGVRGESHTDIGMLGISDSSASSVAVVGAVVNATPAEVYSGHLGNAALSLGVRYVGGLGGSGTKSFYEPHPSDPEKVIRYVCLEGPEAGTYFRGRGRLLNGRAVVEVPDTFRMVTDEEGLSAQVTVIGKPTMISVTSIDLSEIIVEGNRDVEFWIMVNGVRKAYRDFEAVVKHPFFEPRGENDRMIASLSPDEKARLVANGTFNADGTVNMRTAERVGRAEKWREAERVRQQAQKQSISRTPQEQGQAPQQ